MLIAKHLFLLNRELSYILWDSFVKFVFQYKHCYQTKKISSATIFLFTVCLYNSYVAALYFVGSHKSKPSSISRTKQPIEAYELLKHFLILWKSTEVLKLDWSLRKLQVNKIDTPQLHRLMR